MRKLNALLTVIIMIMFLLHAVFGSFQLIGIGNNSLKLIGWITLVLILIHSVIGVILTVKTLRIQRNSGRSYFKENRMFWARRISGFVLLMLIALHITAFSETVDGIYWLKYFSLAKLISQILLVIMIVVHVVSNVKPALISFGIRSMKDYSADIIIVISLLSLFMAFALFVYYLRWQAL